MQPVNGLRKAKKQIKFTKTLYEKSGSNGFVLSILFICSGVREISSACKFSRNCSTLRPPMIGNTYGVLRRWYAIATGVADRVSGCTYSVQQTVVRDSFTCGDASHPDFLCNVFQYETHLPLLLGALPVLVKQRAALFTALPPSFFLRIRSDFSSAKDAPRGDRKSL